MTVATATTTKLRQSHKEAPGIRSGAFFFALARRRDSMAAMRIAPFLLIAAAAACDASPAVAQSFPAPPNWGFGYEHYGQVRFIEARVLKMQGLIRAMDYRHQITGRGFQRLSEESDSILRHLRNDAAYGLTPEQEDAMMARVIKLERDVHAAYAERDRRLADPFAYPDTDWRRDADQDSDRNGRDDRWEDDWRLETKAGPPR